MGRNSNYLDGIATLMEKYKLTGWQEPYATLKKQLNDYDAWVRATVLPKARTDFRLPAEEYALALQSYGIDIPPEQIAAMAHQAFTEIQGEMKGIAAKIAKAAQPAVKRLSRRHARAEEDSSWSGDAILPFYEDRLKQIEKIIVEQQIVTLPDRPAQIRIATAAETAQQPAPHMQPPPFLHNTGQKGVFVLPLNIPAGPGQTASEKYDDFTFDAAAWTLTAHEARPGHELQFDSMLEHGVSLARVRYAFNSTNVEGWGLYSEYLIKPTCRWKASWCRWTTACCERRGRFSIRSCRAGKITTADAYRVLQDDVVSVARFRRRRSGALTPIALPARPTATSTDTPS